MAEGEGMMPGEEPKAIMLRDAEVWQLLRWCDEIYSFLGKREWRSDGEKDLYEKLCDEVSDRFVSKYREEPCDEWV